ncbi:hypothetical protein ETAA8_03120 [Anatilimnocola aggregata]|uniref:DUF1559 domain-containing protein n=1 Tax=Anatilimnocola aggregata TaxID=2528021 RepID=A0A517Y4S5_9BACT|nr:DUF1559 domain-containing protein [Anatilimnocola aggregata]QDU25249.1 hypothetical protein ETAA8_03120 [Anatilimnocola aggregata]
MPIPFSCPFCGETTLVDDPLAGHTGPCVNCGKLVTVPSGAPRYSLRTAMKGVQRSNWQGALVLAIFFLGLGVALYAFYQAIGKPAIVAAQQASAKRTCANNLRKLGQALLAYEAQNGSFPPAYTTDASGKPLHSWRALILPYLGPSEMALYQQLDLKVAWDDPRNALVAKRMPAVFASPLDPNALTSQESNYLVIVGAKSTFPEDVDAKLVRTPSARKKSEITDGPENTLLVVEVKANGKSWLEPVDLPWTIDFQIGGDLGGNHHNGANVLMADGEVYFLYDTTPSSEIEAMATVAGGEVVSLPAPE